MCAVHEEFRTKHMGKIPQIKWIERLFRTETNFALVCDYQLIKPRDWSQSITQHYANTMQSID